MNRYLLSTLFVAAGLFIPSFNAQEENRTIEEVAFELIRITEILDLNRFQANVQINTLKAGLNVVVGTCLGLAFGLR